MNSQKRKIGIIGGMGPHAGLDLVKKIFDITKATNDYDHYPLVLFSFPENIPDRSLFLLGQSFENPAYPISDLVEKMNQIGVDIVAFACNQVHADIIFNTIVSEVKKKGLQIEIINLIDEVINYLINNHSKINNIGVLSRLGTSKHAIYRNPLTQHGYNVIEPNLKYQQLLDEVIANPNYGLKSQPNFITDKAKKDLNTVINYLIEKGVEIIILACTELPIAIDAIKRKDVLILDANMILASALINNSSK